MDNSIIDNDHPLKNLLYHYTTIEAAIEKILFEKQLRLSPFRALNDPREAKDFSYSLQGTGLPPEGIDQKHFGTDRKLNELLKDQGKLICFSLDIVDKHTDRNLYFLKGYAKSRMWSQYGQNHRGVCLVFERNRLVESIRSQAKSEDIVYFGEVSYADYSPEAVRARTISGDVLRSGIEIEDYAFKHLQQNYKGLFFEKNLDYRDENEFRIVVITKSTGYLTYNYNDSLIAVVVGVDFPASYGKSIEEMAVASGAALRRAKWQNGKPYLSNNI